MIRYAPIAVIYLTITQRRINSVDVTKILNGQRLALKALADFSDIEKSAILEGASGTIKAMIQATTLGIAVTNVINGNSG